MNARTLVLTPWMAPYKIVSWERAIVLSYLGKVEVLEEYDESIPAVSITLRTPAVVRLTKARVPTQNKVRFSRTNVFLRDGFRCQYCGDRPPAQELTCDHVIPRSHGGRTEWSNIVTCCVPCNRHKGGRTPAEAGLRLIRMPAQPTWLWGVQNRFASRRPPKAWHVYLYLDRDLETVS